MITRHPYRAVGVGAVMAISAFVAGMIGQDNDGPWSVLPEWLAAASWFTFLASVLVILVLSVYLAFANLRYAGNAPSRMRMVSLRATERWKK